MSVIAGFGLTVTVNVNGVAGQLPKEADDDGVIVYIAVCAVFVVLLSVPLMLAEVPLLAAPPVNPAPAGAAQV